MNCTQSFAQTMARFSALCALSACCVINASAVPLRWASAGDLQTLDPYSQNVQLSNAINGQIYENLIGYGRKLELAPQLATSWKMLDPLTWQFKLRPNVKFHDGSAFSADDVIFSFARANHLNSQLRAYAAAVGTPHKIDPLTVEFKLKDVNPIFLEHIRTIPIMSKVWSEKYEVSTPLDYKNKEEKYTSLHANGTGPFELVSRQPDIKTEFKRFAGWWGKPEGSVTTVSYVPIKADATRVAALVSGEVDFILDPPPQDVERLEKTASTKIINGIENRIVFIGMDQGRDELIYSNIKGKNPFKDKRVRQALYSAVDIETIKTKLMRNKSFPTGGMTPSPLGTFNDPAIEKRRPLDLITAKKLLVEAGYPQGFEVSMHCPNNRYINDEKICQALAAMWAKIDVKVKLVTEPATIYFARLEKYDMSLYMLGWGGAITDAETMLTPVLRNVGANGIGFYNYGKYKNDTLDAAAAASSKEPDPKKREAFIKTALLSQNEEVNNIPLHRQIIPWAARSTVSVVHRPDNWLEWNWITIK